MNLPSVNISYDNGVIAQAVSSNDGLLCIAVIGFGKRATFTAGKLMRLTSPSALETYNVPLNEPYDENAHIAEIIKDFYKEAPEGTPVYLVVYPHALLMSEILEPYNPYLSEIIKQTKGEIRGIIVAEQYVKGLEGDNDDNGMNQHVYDALIPAQQFAQWATEMYHSPIFVLLQNFLFEFQNESLETSDMSSFNLNRVGVITGEVTDDSRHIPAVGLVAGRIAVTPVHRHIGRVKDGALKTNYMYLAGKDIDEYAEVLAAAGHITFRRFAGKAGYFITDDPMCSSDDYCFLTRRRTIDKAYRIAYNLLVEELNDEIPINSDGTMLETYATAFEQKVENTIALNMTRNGELSVDPSDANDQGVICEVDRTVNVLATNQITATLRVRPYGYAKYIDVLLGFTVVSQ